MYVDDSEILDQEEFLDLPELNERRIDENKGSILQNRIMIVSLFVLAIVINAGTYIVTKHNLHDCENKLYLKLLEDRTKTE